MATKNPYLSQLTGNRTYSQIIFNQLLDKVNAYRAANSKAKTFMMAFGDTSQPLPSNVVQALVVAANRLGDEETYTGYEDITGRLELREAICNRYYKKLDVNINADEVFISDGAQSASVNISELFDVDNSVGVQDPSYPSFIEGALLSNRPLIKLPCNETDGFIPEVPKQKIDILYLCFPNNPTGAVATHQQLQKFVDYALSYKSVIIFDAVYSPFVSNPNIPRSIYEIEGAEKCAIEIGSFSKWANFTGLRIGWCVVPHGLTIKNTEQGELNHLWKIRHSVKFWGTANIAQQGAIAALSDIGQNKCQAITQRYLKNTRLLQSGLESAGFKCFGSQNSPFVWVKSPNHISSWQFFEELLKSTGIVGVPGCIFGSYGEGFLRLNALGPSEEIREAVKNL